MPKHPGRSPSVPRETTRSFISHHSDANFRTWTGRPGDAPLRRVSNLNDEGCTHKGKTSESQASERLFRWVLHKWHWRFSAFVNHAGGTPKQPPEVSFSDYITIVCDGVEKSTN